MFDKVFVAVDPSYLQVCNQIVVLSVAAAVTTSLESNVAERVSWLEMALASLDASVSIR